MLSLLFYLGAMCKKFQLNRILFTMEKLSLIENCQILSFLVEFPDFILVHFIFSLYQKYQTYLTFLFLVMHGNSISSLHHNFIVIYAAD